MWDFGDCLNFADLYLSGSPIRGEVIGSETIVNGRHDIYIDTCFTHDTGKYETAIGVDDKDLIIVEEYDDKDEATIGHAKWLLYAQSPYPLTFSSIQIPEITVIED